MKTVLIEVKSHVRASDVAILKKKASFFEEKSGKKADRVVMVTPYAEERAFEAAKKLSIHKAIRSVLNRPTYELYVM